MANLITTGFHYPYNPDLVERAKELRKNMTKAERKLWYEFLKNHKFVFLRQRPIDNFILDFYCSELNLAIEVDGDSHYSTDAIEYDNYRTDILKGYDITVLRFTNDDVLKNFDGVCQRIDEFLKTSIHPL
ncbi:MAG: endonuclease domain-containing protein [Bacteroidota bacterium]